MNILIVRSKNILYDLKIDSRRTVKFILLFLITSTAVSQAAGAMSQSLKLTFKYNSITVQQVCNEIEKMSDYLFVFSEMAERSLNNVVSVSVESDKIDEVLDDVFEDTNLTYRILDKQIVVYENKESITARSANQQPKGLTFQGTVFDDFGVPLPNVNIYLKSDRTIGTITDADGNYSVTVPDKQDVLIFSFIGMINSEVNISSSSNKKLNVRMKSDDFELGEVVITGIVTKSKESFTGSSASYSSEEIKAVGTQNVVASLKTLDPSFNVLESAEFGSDPNRMPDIEIRGKSSLISTRDELSEDPNQPLFILDGFESSLEAVYNLDINRVESITILKDAASTAIYGSKASNGVVVVETIKPKAGKLNLAYNGSFNISWADLTSYNLMNASEKLEFERMSGRYSGGSSVEDEVALDQLYNNKLADVLRGVDTYWLAEPLHTGINQRHSLYASGGEGAFQFGLGVAYNGIDGVMKGSKRSNISESIDLTYRLNKLQFSNKLYMDNTSSANPIVGYSDYSGANPYYTKYNENGEVEKWLEYNDYVNAPNPLYNAAQNSYNSSGAFTVSNRFIAEYTPVTELKIRARFGLTHTNNNSEVFSSPMDSRFTNVAFMKRGTYNNMKSENNKYEGELTATYGKMFNDYHLINLSAGSYISQSDVTTSGYSVQGFPVGDYTLPSFSNGYPDGGTPTYYEDVTRSVSAYAIGNYSFDNRYLLDFSYRVNGSSIFGVTKKYIGTWAVGAAWNLHRENFIKDNIDGISMFKIRGSVGNPGNQSFSSSATITTFRYNFNMLNYFGMTTSLAQLGNPDLQWQTTLDKNIGIDLTLLDDKLTVVADVYHKNTDPLLIGIAMPPSTGATGNMIYKNFGSQQSSGFTLQSTYYILRDIEDRMWWTVRGSVRSGNNKLNGIGNRLDMFNTEGRTNNSTKRYFDGADPDDLWAVRSAGIDPATGKEIFITKDGELTYDFSYDNEVIVGNSRPKVEGILGTSFNLKQFSFNFDFRYRVGGYAFNGVLFNKVENISSSQLRYNQDRRALYDRWQKPGDIAQYKNIASALTTPMSSRFVQKDNTLSLESFRVGYELKPEVAAKLGVSSMRLNAYMNDIFRLSTIKMERGTTYPFARSLSLSLSLTL